MAPMKRKVLISPSFGAGWSTWAGEREQQEFALFDGPLIAALERGEDIGHVNYGEPKPGSVLADYVERFKARFGETPYVNGARELEVVEVEGEFQVDEYDGSESIRRRDEDGWYAAPICRQGVAFRTSLGTDRRMSA